MRILPVLDLKSGQVVHARAGRRQEYKPIVSRFTHSSRPVDVAQAFRDRFGLTELYIADLDAIAGSPPALATLGTLQSLGFRLWVDGGVRDLASARPFLEADITRIVVGLETVAGPEALSAICQQIGAEKVVFSLDLKDGLPLCDHGCWLAADAWSIVRQVIAIGVRQILVLDLACVGGQGGTGTEELCKRLALQHPEVELAAGGGIRDRADLQRLEACGVRTALVASALHDGRIGLEDISGL